MAYSARTPSSSGLIFRLRVALVECSLPFCDLEIPTGHFSSALALDAALYTHADSKNHDWILKRFRSGQGTYFRNEAWP